MKVLVTGSEGSLGQAIIKSLLKNTDFHIVGVDNFYRHGKINRIRHYEFIEANLNDKLELPKVDYIIHCAARLFGAKGYAKFPAEILGNDTHMLVNLLNYISLHNIKKFIYISSSMVYEQSESNKFTEEEADLVLPPKTEYGLSKFIGEKIVKAYNKQYSIPYMIWRPFNIFTPEELPEKQDGMSHVFSDFFRKIVLEKQKEIEIFGDGQQIRCFSWVYDIADFIVNHGFKEETSGQTYNVGYEQPTRIIDLAKLIWSKTRPNEEFKVKFVPIHSNDVKFRVPSCEKVKLMGWKETKTLEQMVDEYIRKNNE